MKYGFLIKGEIFTKDKVKEKCRTIRDRCKNNEFLNDLDTAFILECVDVFCPMDKRYLINNIEKIFVDIAPHKTGNGYRNNFNTRCFYAICKDTGMRDDFGLFKWIDLYNRDARKDDINRACRDAISRTVIDKIENCIFPRETELPGSEVIIQSRSDAHVDHYDKDFAEVVEEWIDLNGGIDTVFSMVKLTGRNSGDCEFINETIKRDFDNYCSNHSHLRVISKEENLARPKQKIKKRP